MIMAVSSVTFEDNDLGEKALIKQIKKLDDSHTDVGLFGSGGGPADNLAARGVVHELGSRAAGIPSRPWNRKCFDDNLNKLQGIITKKYNQLLERKIGAKRLLKQTGEWYEGKLKDTIDKGGFTQLKASTIARKGSSKALIDTADMKNRTEHRETMK